MVLVVASVPLGDAGGDAAGGRDAVGGGAGLGTGIAGPGDKASRLRVYPLMVTVLLLPFVACMHHMGSTRRTVCSCGLLHLCGVSWNI